MLRLSELQWRKPLRLILIRHAEAHRRGFEDLGLTAKGRAQAERLAVFLSERGELEGVRRVLTSPAPRARETAAVISAKTARETETVDALSEMQELPPLGSRADELFSSFTARVSSLLDELAASHASDTVIAVTHARVVVASVLSLFGIPRPGTGARLEPGYCSVTEWLCEEGLWTLKRFNTTDEEVCPPDP